LGRYTPAIDAREILLDSLRGAFVLFHLLKELPEKSRFQHG